MDSERILEREASVKKANAKLKEIISHNIRYYRILSGMSEDELALCIGKKGEYVKKLENKELKANPSIKTLDMIARALGVRFTALIFEDDDRRRNE